MAYVTDIQQLGTLSGEIRIQINLNEDNNYRISGVFPQGSVHGEATKCILLHTLWDILAIILVETAWLHKGSSR
jgi:hypothetical protein